MGRLTIAIDLGNAAFGATPADQAHEVEWMLGRMVDALCDGGQSGPLRDRAGMRRRWVR